MFTENISSLIQVKPEAPGFSKVPYKSHIFSIIKLYNSVFLVSAVVTLLKACGLLLHHRFYKTFS